MQKIRKMQIYVVLFVTEINRDPNAATLICGISDYFKDTDLICEPVHEKTNNLGFRQGLTQTGLYSHRRGLAA